MASFGLRASGGSDSMSANGAKPKDHSGPRDPSGGGREPPRANLKGEQLREVPLPGAAFLPRSGRNREAEREGVWNGEGSRSEAAAHWRALFVQAAPGSARGRPDTLPPW
ncbi:hypothetical protein NDU88_003424 [Pleurodeles waltl]|uniref:Uncharacterized protein n=1 Tax=Pleurodeles waltl TaxID=8319 RepID=A0AAV7RHC4_PLEWA|nr:hypothetical protein NDU88_003424 [Pleurodeles waltl]